MFKRAYPDDNTLTLFRRCQSRSPISNKGFTLIELTVVVVFAGILATLSLPVLFSQVGRARETETKSNLSAIGQAQQAYLFENGTFADNYGSLDVSFQGKYYTYPQPTLLTTNSVRHQANPINGVNSSTRTFSMGVYYTNFAYSVILCRSASTLVTTEAPPVNTGACSNGGIQEF